MDTFDLIKQKLQELEKKEDVTVLYAVESGSRAWGFESSDSDYDVRFIYKHNLDWYLSIEEKRDVIEQSEGVLDISGWDIKKALKLFSNSNPPLYEWLESPIVYLNNESFIRKLRKLVPLYYSSITTLNHYLHMAQGNYKEYLTSEIVKTKKYFYVLRPLLACMWIEKQKSMPPMEFEKLLLAQEIQENVYGEIQKLLSKKRRGRELGKNRRIDTLDDFLRDKLEYYEEYVKKLKPTRGKTPLKNLNSLFRSSVIE